MPLFDSLDFQKAFRRIDKDRHDDAYPDIVGYRDVKRRLDEIITLNQNNLGQPIRYRAGLPLCIDIPKKGFTLRPGVVPLIEDRLIYQAIADLLAPHFTPEPNVYSNRLAGDTSDQMFIQGVKLWVDFQNCVEEYCHQFPYVVVTDITAYFDHINHDMLFSRITNLFRDVFDRGTITEIRTILGRLLGRWNFGLKKFGIPQINDASSFMANLYLDELDKWLLVNNFVFLRYVDDIRIFADSEPNARRLLAELIVKMREMGLYVASGKTKIKPSADVLRELEEGRNQIKQIEAEIESRDPERLEIAAGMLADFFQNLIANRENFNDRLFRFCVNRFKKLHVTRVGLDIQEIVRSEVLARLGSMPESTDIFIDYLSLFPENRDLQASVLEFLISPYNIYPWQEMHLLELLIRSEIAPDLRAAANQIANSIINSGRHPACKSKAYVLRGKIGNYADRRDIRERFVREEREDVKRAILVGVQEMDTRERNYFYQNIYQESLGLGMTVDYIQTMHQPTYYYYNPPSPYEMITPDHDSDDWDDLGSEYFI